MKSFARQILDRGYPVNFLVSPGYRWMNDDYESLAFYTPENKAFPSSVRKALTYFWFNRSYYRSLLLRHPPAVLLLVSWHPLNFLFVRLAKSLYPEIPIFAWIHEPYKDKKSIYGSKAIIISLVEWFQSLSLWHIDVVILHSARALQFFGKRYPSFQGIKYLIPLQFKDEKVCSPRRERRYLSFLGRADRAKGIDRFFSLVEGMAHMALEWQFQIVTSSNIQLFVERLSLAARQKLRVIFRPHLSDDDLRQGAANSLAVLALYKETTQSGVIPVAWMQGAPVIGTNIEGITEWIRDKETGVIVSTTPSATEIMAAITYIQSHFEEMSARCRASYLSTFDDGKWEDDYGWIIPYIQGDSG